MGVRFTVAIIAVMAVMLAGSASAQPRVPDTDMSAVSGNAGLWLPKSNILETAGTVAGTYEYYFTPRVGLRTLLGWTEPDVEGTDDSIRQIRLTIDVLYNWEGGRVHPYVGAGFGAYFLRIKSDGRSVGDSETRPGFNLGAGVEYFTTRTVTIKGEAFYHAVSRGDDFPTSPSGLALMAGIKKYF